MSFGNTVRDLRKEKGLSQTEFGKAVGVSLRTVRGWEVEGRYPKSRSLYAKMAEVLGCDVNGLLSEEDYFVADTTESFGERGAAQAKALLEQTKALYAGGELSDEDRLTFLQDIQRLFLESKQTAHDKFTPKKYKDNTAK